MKVPRFLLAVIQWVKEGPGFTLAAFISLILGFIGAFLSNTHATGLGLVAFIVLLLAKHLDRFLLIKAGVQGIEVQLSEVIRETEEDVLKGVKIQDLMKQLSEDQKPWSESVDPNEVKRLADQYSGLDERYISSVLTKEDARRWDEPMSNEWEHLPLYSLWQASWLWKGLEPIAQIPDASPAYPILQTLKAAIETEKLPAYKKGESVNVWTMVTAADLSKFASEWVQEDPNNRKFPRFLHPQARLLSVWRTVRATVDRGGQILK